MKPEEKIQYVDVGLRLLNIQLHKELLKKVIQVIEVVDKKKGNSNIQDFLELKNETKKNT
jgi:hypothetical protein